MKLKFGLTQEFTNTQYAPLAALLAYYEAEKALEPLQSVTSASLNGDFTLAEKLEQTLISILAGCEYISVVNTKLRPERNSSQFASNSKPQTGVSGLTRVNHDLHFLVAQHEIGQHASGLFHHFDPVEPFHDFFPQDA